MTAAPALPAGFHQFLGNAPAVESLRAAISAGRLPHALILSGPAGAGKYTLALMLAMAVECQRQPREQRSPPEQRSRTPETRTTGEETTPQPLAGFCGECSNCIRIAAAANLEEQVAAAVLAREDLRETDKKETRVLIQPHPDVLILPPDPPQNLIKLGQIRALIQRAHYLPAEAPRRIFILTSASMMKEAANSLLKILEEPPETVLLLLLAENPGELLPTIRSRCATVRLGALPVEEIEALLATRRPGVPASQRALIARLAQGAVGRAFAFDLEAYTAARADALIFLRNAAGALRNAAAAGTGMHAPSSTASSEWVGSSTPSRTASSGPDHTALFKMTEAYRAGADGQTKTAALLRALALLLEDLLLLDSGTPELVRNTDLRAELERLSAALPFAWIESASHSLDQVHAGLRRNLLRSLSLDAMAAAFAAPPANARA